MTRALNSSSAFGLSASNGVVHPPMRDKPTHRHQCCDGSLLAQRQKTKSVCALQDSNYLIVETMAINPNRTDKSPSLRRLSGSVRADT